jgi:AraC-like DNA-binding protein
VIRVEELRDAPVVSVERRRSDDVAWVSVDAAAPAELDGVVARHVGYQEWAPNGLARREVPHGGVVLILNLDRPLHVGPADGASDAPLFSSFVAGLFESTVRTEYTGSQGGIQVDLTPLGAHRLLGVPMRELANRVVDVRDLGLRQLDELVDRLGSTDDWTLRFSVLDQFLAAWNADGPGADPSVTWAWNQITRAHGQVSVAELASETGWSRRHFSDRFREQVGLTPKAMARVVRFHRAATMVAEVDGRSITDIASQCGFADHSHLVRDFQALAGCTPSEYRGAQLPGGPGVSA